MVGGGGGARLPCLITRSDGAPMAFAAVRNGWEGGDSCAMVTVDAGPGLAAPHHREPVILEPSDWTLWLGEAGQGAAPLMATRGPLACCNSGVVPMS